MSTLRLGVVGELLVRVLERRRFSSLQAEVQVPVEALLDPVLVPLLVGARFTKNSISICSNSRVRKMKLPGVISFLKDFPIWAIPNGTFTLLVCKTFLKLTKIPCAVSGRKYARFSGLLTGPM